MPVNKRRHANAIPIASFATWLVIGIFACVSGLGYVYCKNQLHTAGAQIKTLERELADLRNRNEVARTHIAQLSSTRSLQERFDNGFIKLSRITDDKIVMVGSKGGDRLAGEVRAVSNVSTP
ncbi:MAG TPA: hypothetical protein VF593_10005 [Chthoniobacteraceae bacterium]|jgi:hypothetical protein